MESSSFVSGELLLNTARSICAYLGNKRGILLDGAAGHMYRKATSQNADQSYISPREFVAMPKSGARTAVIDHDVDRGNKRLIPMPGREIRA
jgi:hypothetical protein